MPEIIDNSRHGWHVRTRQGLPFEVRWNRPGHPAHFFQTRAAAEAAIAEDGINALNRSGLAMLAGGL